jgi:segregation and condensation protein A
MNDVLTAPQEPEVENEAKVSVPSSTEDLSHVYAKVNGIAFTQLPEDLYIPPDALEVFLEAFEGPLDLLLYLIRKHNLDILNIPIAEITRQYMDYVELMKEMRLELAADYLVMAAMLAEIKSRMLLPRSEDAVEEEDPRAELVRRLQEYERFKAAAEKLELMPRMGRDVFSNQVDVPTVVQAPAKPEVDLSELLGAFLDILKRSELLATHKVQREALSVRERMSHVLDLVNSQRFIIFQACFNLEEGRLGVVVSFLAILELLRLGLIDIVQTEPYGQIHLKVIQHDEADEISINQNPTSIEGQTILQGIASEQVQNAQDEDFDSDYDDETLVESAEEDDFEGLDATGSDRNEEHEEIVAVQEESTEDTYEDERFEETSQDIGEPGSDSSDIFAENEEESEIRTDIRAEDTSEGTGQEQAREEIAAILETEES